MNVPWEPYNAHDSRFNRLDEAGLMKKSTMNSACPFCNTSLPPLSAPPAGEKLPCPRCGELVPASRWQVDTSIAAGEPKYNPAPSPAMSAAIRGGLPGNRKTAFIILGIMVTMAIVGLSYALWTTKLRRSRDPRSMLDPITFRKPLELQGLGYLPKDSQVIVGLHIAEWLADKKVGKPLLDEPRPAALDWVVKQLPRVTGLPLEEIDHVVLAASFDNPQVVMVIKARRPYDLSKIAEHAKPSNTPLYQEKTLYEIVFHPPVESLLWCVEEKTLVCVLRIDTPKIEHLHGLSATPRRLDEVLSAPLHDALKERLPKHQFAWAVGRLDKLGLLKDALPLLPIGMANLKEVKTFALGLEPVEGLTLTGHFQTTDAKSAAKLKVFLDGVKIEGATQKLAMPNEGDNEQWLTWQVRGDVAAMREWLNQKKGATK
jgi:hypothetical protein